MVAERHSIAGRMIQNFNAGRWPATTLISGDQTEQKHNFIISALADCLFKNQNANQLGRAAIEQAMHADGFADFYYFGDGPVAIGTEKKSQSGTVRHLLRHFLPYAPRNGSLRFVYFADAAKIRNEAESALLKSLEEPLPHTHFVLSVGDDSLVKDTIKSRSIIVPFVEKIKREEISPDPWQRYFYLSAFEGSEGMNLMKNAGYLEMLKEAYDNLQFSNKDFLIFDQFGPQILKKKFSKITQEQLAQVMKGSLMPLFFSLRDAAIEGHGATEGPLRLAIENKQRVLRLFYILVDYFKKLDTRYFGTRVPNLNVVYYAFLCRFQAFWAS